MQNQKSTKRAFGCSVVAVAICVAMLIGTTFAWFTSTASTNVNKIESGKLAVGLEVKKADGSWENAEGKTLNFVKGTNAPENEAVLWEPGCTYTLPAIRVINNESNSNLALKYKLVISGATGDVDLLNAIEFTAKIGEDEQIFANGSTLLQDKVLNPGQDSGEITLSGHMKEEAGNPYQGKTVSGIAVTVYATQATVEFDSNGNTYDKFAQYEDVAVTQIPAGDTATVNNAVKEALANVATGESATQIVLPAGAAVSIESGDTKVPQGKTKNIKITGSKNTTVALKGSNGTTSDVGKLSYQDGANLTFEGVTYDAAQASGICARGSVVTFIDCNITGEMKQTIGTKFVFSGCSFTSPVSQVGYGCKEVVFENCTFNTNGYGLKIYSEGSTPVNLTVKNSTFKNTGSAAKSAIFLDHIVDGISYNITVDSCTFEGFTAEPTPNYNSWAERMIVTDSFVKTSDGQYIFSYQTGVEGGNYHKILTNNQLVVTVK